MKRASRLIMFAGLWLLVAVQAQAQVTPWEDRVYVNLNYGYQSRSSSDIALSKTTTIYDETATITSTQTIESKGGMFDVAAGVRLFGNFGVGVAFNTLSKDAVGTISAKVPHPLFYDQPRTASAELSNLTHKETAWHVMGVFALPITNNFDIAVSAGPTFFNLEQQTIGGDVQYSEAGSPYSSITLNSVTKTTTKQSKVGYNVGADLTFRITNHLGLGAFGRYASASVEIVPSGGDAIKVGLGGLQYGGGIRLRF